MLGSLRVLLGQTVSAASIQIDQTICQRAFADGFHDEPAGNIMAFSDHTRDDCMSTPWENMESTICFLTEWTMKAGGHFKVDNVFLIKKGACAAVEDIAFH